MAAAASKRTQREREKEREREKKRETRKMRLPLRYTFIPAEVDLPHEGHDRSRSHVLAQRWQQRTR